MVPVAHQVQGAMQRKIWKVKQSTWKHEIHQASTIKPNEAYSLWRIPLMSAYQHGPSLQYSFFLQGMFCSVLFWELRYLEDSSAQQISRENTNSYSFVKIENIWPIEHSIQLVIIWFEHSIQLVIIRFSKWSLRMPTSLAETKTKKAKAGEDNLTCPQMNCIHPHFASLQKIKHLFEIANLEKLPCHSANLTKPKFACSHSEKHGPQGGQCTICPCGRSRV